MSNTRVKICGITRAEDAALAAQLGADAIGLNFLEGPRKITRDVAYEIFYKVPDEEAPSRPWPHVALCALRQADYPDAATWDQIKSWIPSFTLQIYAKDYSSLSSARDLKLDWWMVRHIPSREALQQILIEIQSANLRPTAILLDTASDKAGGTGQAFNWNWIAEAREAGKLDGLPPIILAGGLTPENVAEAIRIARPYAVDVSSGVEVVGKPGTKDPIKMRDFIQAAKAAAQ